MEVLLLKQEIETKYQLIELLKDQFKIKLISKSDFTADILHTRTNTQFVFDSETVRSKQILLMPMLSKVSLSEISLKSLVANYKMILFRDRVDLADLIIKLCTAKLQTRTENYDPIKFISFLTWERQGLPEADCKIIFDHFKSIENMFNLSKDAREFSIKSLNISEKTKETIMKIFADDEDFFID